MKYRKKPVVIDAMQWTANIQDMDEFVSGTEARFSIGGTSLYIDTLEGRMECRLNDWLIRGVQGEYYPCKPDIFEQTYEAVE